MVKRIYGLIIPAFMIMFFLKTGLLSVPVMDIETYKEFSPGLGYTIKAGTEVLSMLDGEVISVSDDPGNKTNFGRYIDVMHRTKDKKTGEDVEFYILYANLSKVNVKEKQKVKKGETIGLTGDSSPFIKRNELLFCFYTYKNSGYMKRLSGSDGISKWGVYWWNPRGIIKNAGE